MSPRAHRKLPIFGRSLRAFTLTELLVVIVLMAVVVSILFPVLSDVRNRWKTVQCVANLRTAGAAINSYAADSGISPRKRHLEIYSFLGGDVPGQDTWSNLLVSGGYIQRREALRCPQVIPATAITEVNWFYEVYGMNLVTQPGLSIGEVVSLGAFSGGIYRLPLSRVEAPSRLILLADSRAAQLGPNGHERQRFRLLGEKNADAISLRHRGRANILFLDGHVETLLGEEIDALRGKPYAGVPYYDEAGLFHP